MVLVKIAAVQSIAGLVGFLMAHGVFVSDFGDAQSFDGGRRMTKILVDEVAADADGFKNLGA